MYLTENGALEIAFLHIVLYMYIYYTHFIFSVTMSDGST